MKRTIIALVMLIIGTSGCMKLTVKTDDVTIHADTVVVKHIIEIKANPAVDPYWTIPDGGK